MSQVGALLLEALASGLNILGLDLHRASEGLRPALVDSEIHAHHFLLVAFLRQV